MHLLLSALLSLSIWTSQAQNPPPNILYILADDLGYGELGCYGQQKIRTPHLDRLAAEGMRFTQHYSGSTVCAPSRCVLLTGRHTGHAAVRGNYEMGGFEDETEGGQAPLPAGTFTLGGMLQQQGYATACVGKWGLGMADSVGNPNAQGFDLFYGYLCQKQAHNYYPTHLWLNGRWDSLDNAYFRPHQRLPEDADPNDPESYMAYKGKDYSGDRMREVALDFVRQNRDKPFFLYYALPMPHLALQIPDEELAQYEDLDDTPYTGNHGYLPQQKPHAAYAAMISRLDTEVGLLMDLLKELGLDDNTLVVFSSDNGATYQDVGGADPAFFRSNGDLRGCKTNLYEGGIRVPMIARWPDKIAAGTVSDHISAFWDVLPTVADLLEVEVADTLDGISFLPTLLGEARQQQHEYLYWEFPEGAGSQALRWGKWKGIRKGLHKDPDAPMELYDLEADPGESREVSALYPEVVMQMKTLMEAARVPAEIEAWNYE